MTTADDHPPPATRESDDHWVERLSGCEDNPRFLVYRAERSAEMGTVAAGLPAELLQAAGDPPWRVVLLVAGLALLARRYGASGPLLLATPPPAAVSEPRSHPLFLRLVVDERLTAERYLREVGDEVRLAGSHRAYSLADVLGRLGLAAVGEVYRNIGLGFRDADSMSAFRDLADFQLVFELGRSDRPARLSIHYPAGLVAAELVEQLAAHYRRALAFLAGQPAARLADFALLLASEKRQLVADFNDTEAGRPPGPPLHVLFERQAAMRPQATAVVCERQRSSYAEVNELANRLAHHLIADLAVRVGQTVALMVPRSAQMIVSIVAILKSGAAYLPIDPAYPPDVIDDMLEDSGATVLLLSSDAAQKAVRFAGDLCFVDLQLPRLAAGAANPRLEIAGESAAYAIYTSGSTGRRKGILVAHEAIVNTVLWRNARFDFGAHCVTLQIPSYTFDSSVEDIFCMLTSGGALVVPTARQRADAGALRLLIEQHGVTHFLITPSYYRAFLLELATRPADERGVSSLRAVTVAGEEATPELVRTHYRCLPAVALINEYGPTENAVCSTFCALAEGDSRVLIGKPIANVAVYVLDSLMRVLPKGARGELFLAGRGLARGYLNRPDLTAERFVPNPLSPRRSARLYRTLDLARWTVDGNLDVMGRADTQVKVRGFRIEPGEIEAVLRRHPLVAAAAVICKENDRQEKALVAYLVGPGIAEIPEIRRYLSQALPRFMVPDLFRTLDELPVTVHGKVDRRKLMRQWALDGAARQELAAGATALEGSLLGIMAEVLGDGEIGMEDGFFERGGNSLSVLTLVARVRERLDIELAASDVYACFTARRLAAKIAGEPLRR